MNRKQMCIANLRYKRPGASEARQARNLLGYLTYRESRDEGVKLVAGMDRWADHGMGGSVGEIVRHCGDLRSEHVLMFSLVINPNPQLMAMVAPGQREQFLRELTRTTVDGFFEARGIDSGAEFSYVIHHRSSEDPQAPGMHNPHSHVVLPGTIWSEEAGERVPLYFSQNRKVDHIGMLHAVTEQNMTEMMDRYVGPDWEQRIDRLEAVRDAQKQIVRDKPHGVMGDDDFTPCFWCGARQTDEQTSAAGYYVLSDSNDLEFRPFVRGLSHEEAELLARLMALEAGSGFEYLKRIATGIEQMTRKERRALFEELREVTTQRVYQQPPVERRDEREIEWDIGL